MQKINEELLKADVFKLIGLEDIAQDKKEELAQKMADVIQTKVALRVDNQLSEKDQKAFDKLLADDPSEEEVGKFLNEKVENFSEILEEEIIHFKETLMEDADNLKEMMS